MTCSTDADEWYSEIWLCRTLVCERHNSAQRPRWCPKLKTPITLGTAVGGRQPHMRIGAELGKHGSIPRTVHHYWDHGADTGRPPTCTLGIMERNAARNPSWAFHLLNRARTLQALRAAETFVPNVSAAFDCIATEYPQARSDILRWAVLYVEGGVYFDIDIEMLEPFESIFERAVSEHLHMSAAAAGPRGVSTGVLAAPPRHPAVRRMLEWVVGNILDPFGTECAYGKPGCIILTGPGALNRALGFKPTNKTHGTTDKRFAPIFVHDGREFLRQVRYDAGNSACYRTSERRFDYNRQTTPVLTSACRVRMGNSSALQGLSNPICRPGRGFGRCRGVGEDQACHIGGEPWPPRTGHGKPGTEP